MLARGEREINQLLLNMFAVVLLLGSQAPPCFLNNELSTVNRGSDPERVFILPKYMRYRDIWRDSWS